MEDAISHLLGYAIDKCNSIQWAVIVNNVSE